MPLQPTIIATDLESVLVPEIWIAVAEQTGIEELRLTTRDVPDYDQLMQQRLRILREHQLSLADIQAVIATLQPLPGAVEFLQWVRSHAPCIIVSDTFYEFAAPLMAKLGYPTLFCNTLEIDQHNMLAGYRLRQEDGKRHTVRALQSLNFQVIAIGDSYNDTTMLAAADTGILFRASGNVVAAFPQFPAVHEYAELEAAIAPHLATSQ
ncbi:MAG: bifunctional phosphoserine phosphatase/homoserine phosphotransferase ThrH [Chloroflexota bacterium]|nr:bifunctional phosphoserine phosphatase/homoserine phosphotransferase ThrH [Chloroflexota bacterium]